MTLNTTERTRALRSGLWATAFGLFALCAATVRAQPEANRQLPWASATDLWASESALALPQRVELGRPARPLEFSLSAPADGAASGSDHALVVRGAGRTRRWELPGPATDARLRVLPLSDGTQVALVRLQIGGDVWQTVWTARVGRPRLLWHGRTSMRGDPGERRADALRLLEGPGQPAGLVVGRVQEGTRVCGRPPALLEARVLTRSGDRPITLSHLAGPAPSATVTAEVLDDVAPTSPRLRSPLFNRSSSASPQGAPAAASSSETPAPTSLTDGDESTGWRPAPPGRGEFVTANTLTLPIERLEFSLGLPHAAGPAAELRALWMVPATGSPLLVRIPPHAHRVSVSLATPYRSPCLSLVLAEVAGAPGSAPPTLTEVRAFTRVDRPGARAELMGDLAEGGARRAQALGILTALGTPALRALREAWPQMPPDERRAALAVARARARDLPAAGALLLLGARDADPEVSEAALAALLGGLPRTAESLAELTREGGPVGERAGRELARRTPTLALPALLHALGTEGGSERPGLRRALARAAAHTPEARGVILRWAEAEPATPALVSAALALSGRSEGAAADLTARSRERARAFPQRYRLTLALAKQPAEPPGDAWLARELEDPAWMLRAAALRALRERESPRLRALARVALRDDYPRVRALAATLLQGDAGSLVRLATLARRDPWPLVRAAAVEALRPDRRGRRILRAALGDPAPRVRRAAARALGALGDADSVPLLIARLEDDREWPRVLSASAEALASMCAQEAAPALEAIVERARRDDAWEPDQDAAMAAVVALGALPGADARRALEGFAQSEDTNLRALAQRALAEPRRCR